MKSSNLTRLRIGKGKSAFLRIVSRRSMRFFRSKSALAVAALVALVFTAGLMHAQVAGTGTIEGTVEDASGAVVSGAQVTATNTDTGFKSSQKTSGAGSYTIGNLPPGTYEVKVQAAGFNSFVESVTLNALAQMGVNIHLTIGDTQKVVVSGDTPLEMQTENGEVETTIPNSTYEALPVAMNGAPKSPIGLPRITSLDHP